MMRSGEQKDFPIKQPLLLKLSPKCDCFSAAEPSPPSAPSAASPTKLY